ncbi:hypothetical protein EZV73_26735 [Acidaminobacter sp. JC074]|uniref:hypothetical protein n=1 Tax=Acidaminobacter sp. JC074 TaxID=2530199 RepID=UPI001F115364|nr:hypothetical protein [Acidaminobacter sp. JC074]MCH4891204.1 hypothetical protein [Acidaminobacter sp. JC074]
MNQYQMDWVRDELSKNKGSDTVISKDTIHGFCIDKGLDLPKRLAKHKMISELFDAGFGDEFYQEFHEYVMIPVWEVAKYYRFSTYQFNALMDVGAIDLEYRLETFKGRNGNYEAKVFDISILDFERDHYEGLYARVFSDNKYSLRVGVERLEELDPFIEEISKLFEINSISNYERRDKKGYMSYMVIKKIENIEECLNKYVYESNRLRVILQNKEDEICELKTLINDMKRKAD